MEFYEYPMNPALEDVEDFGSNAPVHAPELRRRPGPPLPLRRQQEESSVSVLLLFGIFVTAVALCVGYLAKDYTDAARLGTVPIICTPGFLPNLEVCKSLRAEHGVQSKCHSFRDNIILNRSRFKRRRIRPRPQAFRAIKIHSQQLTAFGRAGP